ncbi:MAG: Gfo/Idh/MocA family protein, partial [Anaerolineales bacterium]
VHICTPNYLHHPMAKAALLAGKHVYCEKPLALTSEQSAELLEVEAETGNVGAVNYNLRFYPLCQDARIRIKEEEIGEVRLVHGHYLQDWLFLKSDWNWRLEPEQGGSMRAVADIGSHWFDMITWLTGHHVTEVMADIATVLPTRLKPKSEVQTFAGKLEESEEAVEVEIETEDYASILFRLSNGARGVVTVSQVSAGYKNQFQWEVDGSKASFRWQQERPNEMWIGRREGRNELLVKDPSLMTEKARWSAGFPGGHAEGYPDTFMQAFKSFYSYLEAGDWSSERNFPTFTDGHRENVLTDAVAKSAEGGSWVQVPGDG